MWMLYVFSCGSATFWQTGYGRPKAQVMYVKLSNIFLLICQLSCQAITEASHALSGSSLLRLCRLVRLVRIIKALPYSRLHTEFDHESSCNNWLANMSTHMYLFHSLSSGLLITVDHGETELKVFLDGHSRRCLVFARLSAWSLWESCGWWCPDFGMEVKTTGDSVVH